MTAERTTDRLLGDWETPRVAHRELSLAKAEYLIADWHDLGAVGVAGSARGEGPNSADPNEGSASIGTRSLRPWMRIRRTIEGPGGVLA